MLQILQKYCVKVLRFGNKSSCRRVERCAPTPMSVAGMLVALCSSVTQTAADTTRRRAGNQRGFSIVEMVTVIAVATVVAAIAVPNFVGLSARYQLVSTAHQVAFDVARAHMKAIGENVYCRVVFATGTPGSRYWLERSDNGTAYSVDGPVKLLPSRVSFNSLPSAVPTFNRLGVGTGMAVIGLVDTRGDTKTVSVNRLGKVAIQ
jgi:prepilin-type N-terminal cleavage/methylation domain-containing protein